VTDAHARSLATGDHLPAPRRPRTGDRDDPRVTCNAPRGPLPHPPDREPDGDLRRPEGRLVTCNVLELARRGGHPVAEAMQSASGLGPAAIAIKLGILVNLRSLGTRTRTFIS
jgi:hypothetical protein